MSEFWSLFSKLENRQTLSWIGGGLVTLAIGAWTVVVYFWPVHAPAPDGAKIVCAQQGGIAAGHDASGNAMTYNGGAPAGMAAGAASCGNNPK